MTCTAETLPSVRGRAPATRSRSATRVLAIVIVATLLCTSCAEKRTDVREESFVLQLPGRWLGGYDLPSDAWIYVTASREEGLTVRIEPRGRDFNEYLQLQRRAEQQLSDEGLALSEPTLKQQGRQRSATYDGIGKTSQRRTRTLLMVSPAAAGSFHYEAFGLSHQQFASRADAVLSKARLLQ
jgi:hypothetical protein